jgi:hypothetical protein
MRRFLLSLAVGAALFIGADNASAQITAPSPLTRGIDIPKTLSYQGLLTGKDGQPVKDGDYAITVNLYSDKDGTRSVWKGTYVTHVQNGVFSIQLGSGESPLPDAATIDGPLFAGVTIGGDEMLPLTQLSAVPYAMNVADGAITAKKMGTDYVGSLSINGQKLSSRGGDINIVTEGLDAAVDPATNTLVLRNNGTQQSGAITTKGAGAQSNTHISGTLVVDGTTNLKSATEIDADLTMGSNGTDYHQIHNVADPTADHDAANKEWVVSQIGGNNVALDKGTAQTSDPTKNAIDISKQPIAGWTGPISSILRITAAFQRADGPLQMRSLPMVSALTISVPAMLDRSRWTMTSTQLTMLRSTAPSISATSISPDRSRFGTQTATS